MTTQKKEIIQAIVAGGVLFVVDALVINIGLFAIFTLMGITAAVVVYLAYLLIQKLRCVDKYARFPFVPALIVVVFAVLVLSANNLNNKIARHRGEIVAQACEDYKLAHGDYPKELTDLVPEFIKEVPKAKYTLSYNEFFYRSDGDNIMLLFVAVPPYSRMDYNFITKEWIMTD